MTATPDTPGGSVDLPEELRSEIREFAQAIPDMDYYEVLGVARDDDTSAIRDAFFARSKRFHPDRYFNKELGVYGDLLHEIYKRIVVANDMLRDPALKARYDKALAPESASASSQLSPAPSSAPASRTPPPAAEPRRSPGRSLRDRSGLRERRNPLAGLRRKLESGQKKARALYDEACELRDGQEFERAASCARSAAAYDPRNKEYADLLGELLPRINGARVLEVRRRGRQLLQRGQVEEAIEALTEASELAPTDASLAAQISELFQSTGHLETAIEYAQRAIDLAENDIEYLKLLGRLYKQDGQTEAARKQLQRAWEMDPMDEEVKAELAAASR